MTKKSKRAFQEARDTAEVAESVSFTGVMERYFSLSTSHALVFVLAATISMIALIYNDFLFNGSVLLYTDIGSDSVNDMFPRWTQMIATWQQQMIATGFSLSAYMGSIMGFNKLNPFDWILVLSGLPSFIHAIVFYVSAAIIATALTTFSFFRLLGADNLSSTIGALSFAFCGYQVLWSAGWFMGIFPVLFVAVGLLAVEYFLQGRKYGFVAPALATMFVAALSSYFIVYWVAFISVYTILRLFEIERPHAIAKTGLIFLAAMTVGALASWSSLAELYSFVTESGRAQSIQASGAVSTYGTNMNIGMFETASADEYRTVFSRLLSNNIQGPGLAYRGIMNYLEGPLLYVGLLAVMFIPVFFSQASSRQRWIYGAALGVSVLFLVFPWFRLAFWGFRLDYFREFTLLISTVFLIVGIRGLHQFVVSPKRRDALILLATCITTLVVLTSVVRVPIHALPAERTAVIALILSISGVALLSMFSLRKYAPILLAVICIIDLSHNAYSTVNTRNYLSSADIAAGKLYGDASLAAIRGINASDQSLFRTIKYFGSGPAIHASINDAMAQNFYGLTGYASNHNKYYLKFMSAFKAIDLADPSQGKWVSGIINRPFLASALGAKYYLTKGQPFGFFPELFPTVDTVQDVYVQRSAVALPLIVGYDEYVLESDFMKLAPERQDYVLYRSLIASDGDVSSLNIKKRYLPETDSSTVTGYSFVALHDARRKLLNVRAKTDYTGLYANVSATEDCMAVVSVPYDKRLKLRLDGKIVEPKIVNIGFFGLACPRGNHEISLTVD